MEGSNTKYKPMKHDLKILENVISKSLLVSAPWWIIDRLSLTPTDMLWLAGIYSQLGAKWKRCKSLCSTQLWEVKVITLQKSILYLGKQTLFVFLFFAASEQTEMCVLSVFNSIFFCCVRVCAWSARLGFCSCETCCFPDKAQWWRLWLYPGREESSPHNQICWEGLPSWGDTVSHTEMHKSTIVKFLLYFFEAFLQRVSNVYAKKKKKMHSRHKALLELLLI